MAQRPERHVPQRSCIACRTARAKRALIRLVRGPDGAARVDAQGREAGRGAYLCATRACWERALSTGALGRALRAELSTDQRATLKAYAATLEAASSGGGGER